MRAKTIKSQLILLVTVLTVFLLAVVLMSLKGMHDIRGGLQTVYQDRVVPLIQLQNVEDAYSRTIVDSFHKVQDQRMSWEQLAEKMKSAEMQAERDWKAYLGTYLTDEEKRLVAEYEVAARQRDAAIAKARVIVAARDMKAFNRFMEEELYAAFEPATQKLQHLNDLQEKLAKQIYEEAAAASGLWVTGFVLLLLVGAGVGAVIGWALMRTVSEPITALKNATERLADGDLSARAPVEGDNELAQLARAFNAMAESLHDIVAKVQRSGIQVSGSSAHIAAAAKEQQATATELAATATQIAASTREISATAKQLVKNVDEVAQVAESTTLLAEGGREGLARMERTMGQMVEASRNIGAKLAVLSEKGSKINTVVTTINKVADQTNLLSLNAAIEAEKAGEHGLGFGVVASEIRRLSDQTAVSTWDIEQMVKEMQSAVSASVMGMEKFTEDVRHGVEEVNRVGEQLAKIVSSVQALAPHFDSVYEATQAQSSGAEQINEAVIQLSQAAQGTAESLRESNSVIVQLSEAAQRLQEASSRFRQLA
jgi:methyl-accepting chemotaxis protein WspA